MCSIPAHVLACSDGTFIGTLGYFGAGGDSFSEYAGTSGYRGIQALVSARQSVVGMSMAAVLTDSTVATWYGATADKISNGQVMNSTCQEGERIVGLAYSQPATAPDGGIGAVRIACGLVVCE